MNRCGSSAREPEPNVEPARDAAHRPGYTPHCRAIPGAWLPEQRRGRSYTKRGFGDERRRREHPLRRFSTSCAATASKSARTQVRGTPRLAGRRSAISPRSNPLGATTAFFVTNSKRHA